MAKLTDGIGDTGGGDIRPGETRTITAKDKQGNILKTMTLFRTTRDYVFDLCDCYNAHRTEAAMKFGAEWFVTPAGDLRLGDNAAWSKANAKRIAENTEAERQRHNRNQIEHHREAAE